VLCVELPHCPGPETADFWPLSAPRAHTEAPCKTNLLWETLRSLKRPGRARRTAVERAVVAAGLEALHVGAHGVHGVGDHLSRDVGTRHY
jgi:hypothetical protein